MRRGGGDIDRAPQEALDLLIDAHAPRENDHRSCIGGGGGEGDFSQDLDSRASLSRIISFAGMSRLQTGTLNSVIEGECAAIAS